MRGPVLFYTLARGHSRQTLKTENYWPPWRFLGDFQVLSCVGSLPLEVSSTHLQDRGPVSVPSVITRCVEGPFKRCFWCFHLSFGPCNPHLKSSCFLEAQGAKAAQIKAGPGPEPLFFQILFSPRVPCGTSGLSPHRLRTAQRSPSVSRRCS